MLFSKPFAKEISDVPEYYKYQVTYVRCEEVIVGRLIKYWVGEIAPLMTASVTMSRVTQGTELGMLSCYSSCFCWRGRLEKRGWRFICVRAIGSRGGE